MDNAHGAFAYVTVGGLNQVQVFRRADFSKVATIPVGDLPHGIWPSGDGARIYVGLENADQMTAIDTLTNTVIATVPISQAAQAIVYVPGAVPSGDRRQGLQPLGLAGEAAHVMLGPMAAPSARSTTVSLFDQGLVQIVQAAVTGLKPKTPYVLAVSEKPDGSGPLQGLSAFTINPAGAAIVDASGLIRQLVLPATADVRRYFVIAPGAPAAMGAPVQVQQ